MSFNNGVDCLNGEWIVVVDVHSAALQSQLSCIEYESIVHCELIVHGYRTLRLSVFEPILS